MSEYAKSLQDFHAKLAERAAPHGFKVKGSIATGKVILTRLPNAWVFNGGALASTFLDGYELARSSSSDSS